MKRLLVIAAALGLSIAPALASDAIRIVGSSTVYPFTTAVAEQFAKKNGVSALSCSVLVMAQILLMQLMLRAR
jgi:phosphate transport system substrate-binding protein